MTLSECGISIGSVECHLDTGFANPPVFLSLWQKNSKTGRDQACRFVWVAAAR
jgi:hypothetical protein